MVREELPSTPLEGAFDTILHDRGRCPRGDPYSDLTPRRELDLLYPASRESRGLAISWEDHYKD